MFFFFSITIDPLDYLIVDLTYSKMYTVRNRQKTVKTHCKYYDVKISFSFNLIDKTFSHITNCFKWVYTSISIEQQQQ